MPSQPTPAERFAPLALWLGKAMDTPGLAGRLLRPLLILIMDLLGDIQQSFAALAARIEADRAAAGCPTTHRPPSERKTGPHRSRCRMPRDRAAAARTSARTSGRRAQGPPAPGAAGKNPPHPPRLRPPLPPPPDPVRCKPAPWHAHIIPYTQQ